MCGDKDRVTHFKMIYGLFLESVQFERILDARVYVSESIVHEIDQKFALCAISGTSSWKLVMGFFTSITCAQSRFCILVRRGRRPMDVIGLRCVLCADSVNVDASCFKCLTVVGSKSSRSDALPGDGTPKPLSLFRVTSSRCFSGLDAMSRNGGTNVQM